MVKGKGEIERADVDQDLVRARSFVGYVVVTVAVFFLSLVLIVLLPTVLFVDALKQTWEVLNEQSR